MSLPAKLPPLHVDGARLVDPQGHAVILRGCNLGNWFMIEHWIWDEEQPKGSSQDQYELEQILAKRFGVAEEHRLMELYRESWITDRDFSIIKSFRFNCVRLPLNYRMFEDDSKPFHLRADAWKWTDRAIRMAERHGIYVILDMHGAEGGQNPYDHSGRSNQNKLWTVSENGRRLDWLWSEIAKRYRHDSAVVAYDVFNEPYGGQFSQIKREFEHAYSAIRRVDPDKLIWAPGRYDGFDFYGDPHANGWKNVGIEMHYYPGLFGNGSPSVRNQVEHLHFLENVVEPKVKALGVPFYVGEMNVVFKSAGGAEMMRRTYDLGERFGWNTTMWTYKALSRGGGIGDASWGMVTNKNPIPAINFATSSKSEIRAFFRCHATMTYDVYEELRKAMAPRHVDLGPIPEFARRLSAPQGEMDGWQMTDLGGARTGGFEKTGETFSLFGGGADVWGAKDQCRFLYQKVSGDFEISVRVTGLEDLGSYCKAGLMLRTSLGADAPDVLLSTFPSGDLQVAHRPKAGADTQGSAAKTVGIPTWLRLARHGGTVTASYRKTASAPWTVLETVRIADWPKSVLVGAIALSHDDSQLVRASYADMAVRRLPEEP